MTAANTTLDSGRIGATYRVCGIELPVAVEKRLEALGVTEGTCVKVLNSKGKGALVINVRGSRFAIGQGIAAGIRVEAVAS